MALTWDEAVQQESCEEQHSLRGSPSRLDSSDPENVVLMDVTVQGEGSTLSLASTERPQGEQVSQRVCTEPMHPYQLPQILETSDKWYQGDDCFDPGQIIPVAALQHLPSPDGGLDWGGDESTCSPDSLDWFMSHLKTRHPDICKQGRGNHLTTFVEQAQFIGNNPVYWPISSDDITLPKARLCGVLPPTNAQMENPIIAAWWVAHITLMKDVWNAFAHKECKVKRQGGSLDCGASGGKKSNLKVDLLPRPTPVQ